MTALPNLSESILASAAEAQRRERTPKHPTAERADRIGGDWRVALADDREVLAARRSGQSGWSVLASAAERAAKRLPDDYRADAERDGLLAAVGLLAVEMGIPAEAVQTAPVALSVRAALRLARSGDVRRCVETAARGYRADRAATRALASSDDPEDDPAGIRLSIADGLAADAEPNRRRDDDDPMIRSDVPALADDDATILAAPIPGRSLSRNAQAAVAALADDAAPLTALVPGCRYDAARKRRNAGLKEIRGAIPVAALALAALRTREHRGAGPRAIGIVAAGLRIDGEQDGRRAIPKRDPLAAIPKADPAAPWATVSAAQIHVAAPRGLMVPDPLGRADQPRYAVTVAPVSGPLTVPAERAATPDRIAAARASREEPKRGGYTAPTAPRRQRLSADDRAAELAQLDRRAYAKRRRLALAAKRRAATR